MNRTLILPSALLAGFASMAVAQTAATAGAGTMASPVAAATATTAAPQAIPAKVALIAFEQSVFATNEGQRAVQDVQTKYAPRKSQIDTLANEVDSLKKQLQSAPATLSDEEKQTRLKNIDTKEKQLTRDADDAQQAYNTDLQEAYGAEGVGDGEELLPAERLYAAAGRVEPGQQCDVGECGDRRDPGRGGCV